MTTRQMSTTWVAYEDPASFKVWVEGVGLPVTLTSSFSVVFTAGEIVVGVVVVESEME